MSPFQLKTTNSPTRTWPHPILDLLWKQSIGNVWSTYYCTSWKPLVSNPQNTKRDFRKTKTKKKGLRNQESSDRIMEKESCTCYNHWNTPKHKLRAERLQTLMAHQLKEPSPTRSKNGMRSNYCIIIKTWMDTKCCYNRGNFFDKYYPMECT